MAERLASVAGGPTGRDDDYLAHEISTMGQEVLRRQLEELTVLRAIALASANATSVDTFIDGVVRVVSSLVYPDCFGVGLIEPGTGAVDNRVYSREQRAVRRFITPAGQGIVGQVVAEGRPRCVPDVRCDPHYWPINPAIHSEICVPLCVGERIIGEINAESEMLAAFGPADERLMFTLASQLATAIERLQLLEAEREQRRLAETLAIEHARLYEAAQREIAERRRAEAERDQIIAELQQSLAQVKTLGGLLPICAACKRIRNDEGYWQAVEEYITQHSAAAFTHGLCPECMAKLYPGLMDDD